MGDNPEAAAFAGISVPRTVLLSFVLCGVLCGLAGFMMASFDGYAIYTQGNSMATFPSPAPSSWNHAAMWGLSRP